MSCLIINLESGLPAVDVALSRLSQGLRSAKASRTKAVKVIHGYGSGGTGGAIKAGLHRFLTEKKRAGYISDFVRGEDFSPFSSSARQALLKCPFLTRDQDYAKGNPGITIIVL